MDTNNTDSAESPRVLPASKTLASNAPAQKKSKGVFFLFFLLIIVAGVGGAAGFLGWQQMMAVQSDLEKLVSQDQSNKRAYQQQEEKISSLRSKVASLLTLSENSKKLHKKIASLEKNVKDEQFRLTRLAAQMAKVTNHDEVDWQLDQLEYYTLLAHKRLKLTHDVPGAIALLEESITIAKDIDEPQALNIMQALESDKAALSMAEDVNVEHVFVQIDEVIKKIDQLAMPVVNWVREKATNVDVDATELKQFSEVDDSGGYFDIAVQRVSSTIKSFVRIQTLDKPVKPLLPPEQRIYLSQNFQLLLEQAQLSAMRRQGGNYQASLGQAQRWLGEYFREDTAVAKYVKASLEDLLEIKVDFQIPEITTSMEAVKSFSKQWPDIKQKRLMNTLGVRRVQGDSEKEYVEKERLEMGRLENEAEAV